MSYLKSLGTSFVYIVFFLSVITFSPGLPPTAEFSEYSIKPPSKVEGVFALNDRLNDPEILFKGELKGAESFDSWNGELYTGMHGGYVGKVVGNKLVPVVKFGKDCGGIWEEEKCGRPLGLKFDKQGRLYVVDAYYGIFKVDVKTGKYEQIFDNKKPIEGKIPQFLNSIDVAKNGDVYWTESSTEFKLYDGVFAMLANPAGRLIRYNVAKKKNEVLLNKLGLANGLKLSDDESYVIVAETLKSTVLKYHLKGAKAGKSEIFIDGLPGTPDNIHSDGRGNYLVTLFARAHPEHPQITQTLIPHPYLRKMVARLLGITELPFKLLNDLYPNEISQKAMHKFGSFEAIAFMIHPEIVVLRIDGNGKVLDTLHNTDEKIGAVSSAFILGDYLWLGSPLNEFIGRVPLKQAFPSGEFSSKQKVESRNTRESREPEVHRKVEKPVEAPKPTTTTPKPTTTTPKPTTTTPKPTTTTPKPTTTTPKPTTTTPKPTTTTPKPTTTTQKPTTPKPTTTTPKPTTTTKPPPPKFEEAPPASNAQRERQSDGIPKKVVETSKPPKRVNSERYENELPRPIKQHQDWEEEEPQWDENVEAREQSEPKKWSNQEQPNKYNAKLDDEM